MALRDEFPVLERIAYLNAGTDGPIPRVAADVAREEIAAQAAEGRLWPHFERRRALQNDLREGYARLLGCDAEEVAVTSGTSAGLGAVLAGLDLGPGDEILTSEHEHPGLLGPLIAARFRGAMVRAVPFAQLAEAVDARTTLVAASHVNWITGEVAPAELADVPVPVILDGAQGAGAVPVDVLALGCVAYAAAGQKWLCGADGTGMLYLQPDFGERVRTIAPTYHSFDDASRGLDSILRASARRFDARAAARRRRVLAGGVQICSRRRVRRDLSSVPPTSPSASRRRSPTPATPSRRAGAARSSRSSTRSPTAARQRLAEAGVALRDLPGHPYLRASVGAWNDESDLERLLAAL